MMKTLSDATPTLSPAPAEAAKEAGLRYVSDEKAGLSRRQRGKDFQYLDAQGKIIRDAETLRRVRHLAIPPAWTEVWICPLKNGHIQATGRDARGRKQYRYHPDWREVRDEAKFTRVLAFGGALPKIRRRVTRDLRRRGMDREKVLATVLRLLETTLIRVGNDEYAQQNNSYGLTTLRNRHAKVRGSNITFQFVGKSGKSHRIDVQDRQLAKMIRRCQDLPGQELFGYLDDTGAVHHITSEDVNEYLRSIAGEDFSAKDFRTWSGTILAAIALREFEQFASNREAKQNVTKAIEAVAKMLGNTATICRKCYVHPAVLDGYLAGQTIATLRQAADEKLRRSLSKLRPEEAAVMMFLRERLAETKRSGANRPATELLRKSLRKVRSKKKTPIRSS